MTLPPDLNSAPFDNTSAIQIILVNPCFFFSFNAKVFITGMKVVRGSAEFREFISSLRGIPRKSDIRAKGPIKHYRSFYLEKSNGQGK